MKERFLNIFLFLISLVFIGCGIILMFFNKIDLLKIVYTNFNTFLKDETITRFCISLIGTMIFTWGIFFFLLSVFTVMELKSSSIYGFVFWGFTFWALSLAIIAFLYKFYFAMIVTGIIYSILFLPFFLSMPMKSSSGDGKGTARS
ncbi:MAG TPA: hypothetical protein PLE45_05325 [Spirochaetota bacterium]|nr:hypothetical protein [Spirochaetota bacterium]HOL57145.1 hypothetical protein [Spirochaetota bacterium]HPP03901.1 hypothetical protein [Spirochaetota bacterium]